MSRKSKTWLIVGGALILAGGILFAVSLSLLGWNFADLSTSTYETKEYAVAESFRDLRIEADTADVTVLVAEDGVARVEIYEEEAARYRVSVENGTLTVRLADEREWYHFIGVNFDSPQIRVYLPIRELGTLTVEVDTGDVTLNRCEPTALRIVTDTGDVTLDQCHAAELRVDVDAGDVTLNRCDADAIYIETDTGDVTGTLLTEKTFRIETDTGRYDVPYGTVGGLCAITTDTGDIKIEIVP